MDRERWKRVEALYLAALDAPDRAAFLAEICGRAPDLHRDVETLLAQKPHTTALFDQLAAPDGRQAPLARKQLEADSAFGRYRIGHLLGSGGSSDVYRAFDPSLDRDVALKVFAEAALTPEIRQRFVLEAKAAASLNDANIATIYEVGEVEGWCYIALEYVDGVALRERLRDPGCTLPVRLAYLQQIARALEHAHAHGVIHCDLKPENVMLTAEDLVKILDFGLARLMQGYRRERGAGAPALEMPDEMQASSAGIEGTVGYLSPEQAVGKPLDARSDVFSFGCMLFEAATGITPFLDASVVRSLHKLMYDEPTSKLPRRLPAGLRRLITGCLAKDPALRWSSMAEVRRQLDAILDPRARARRSNRTRVALVAVLVVAAGIWLTMFAAHIDPYAYEQVVRGRFEMWRYTPESSRNAIRNFVNALNKQPTYALAAAELANSYRRSGLAGIQPPDTALPLAEEAALKAIALDGSLPQAHTVLADIKRDQWKWAEAAKLYRDTIKRFPAYIPARVSLAIQLSVMGDKPGARAELLQAQELARQQDPVGNAGVIDFAAVFYNIREFGEALAILDSSGYKDNFAPALNTWKGIVYGGSGRPAEAAESLRLARSLGDKTQATACYYVHALARTNRHEEALRLLDEVKRDAARAVDPLYVPPSSLAIAYVGLEQPDRALDLLETAYSKRDPLLPYIVVEWHLDPIRDRPRFQRIVTQMGLSP